VSVDAEKDMEMGSEAEPCLVRVFCECRCREGHVEFYTSSEASDGIRECDFVARMVVAVCLLSLLSESHLQFCHRN
jgi:hypothetical protein